jgi:hypothetical protein
MAPATTIARDFLISPPDHPTIAAMSILLIVNAQDGLNTDHVQVVLPPRLFTVLGVAWLRLRPVGEVREENYRLVQVPFVCPDARAQSSWRDFHQ